MSSNEAFPVHELHRIFKGVIVPDITVTAEHKLFIPSKFTINIDGDVEVYEILKKQQLFINLPMQIQKGLLDILYVILQNPYDVTRFHCYGDRLTSDPSIRRETLNSLLIKLLRKYQEDSSIDSNESLKVQKRILRLLGVTCAAGLEVNELHQILVMLQKPSAITIPLLKAIKRMMKHNYAIEKATPSIFFNFGGYGSGITSNLDNRPNPFQKEYHCFTWFRVESFESNEESQNWRQHVMTFRGINLGGLDVYIETRCLVVAIIESTGVPIKIIKLDTRLIAGVWYHVSVRHSKPRFGIFSRDELSIYLDHQVVFQENIKYPSVSSMGALEFSCGRNFNGQITPVYFANEIIPHAFVELMARLDTNKFVEGISNGTVAIAVDLLGNIATSDKKTLNITSKMETVFHPTRCVNGHAIDIHAGRHGKLGINTHCFLLLNARDALGSIGGLSSILPLFPRLLIENDQERALVATGSSTDRIIIKTDEDCENLAHGSTESSGKYNSSTYQNIYKNIVAQIGLGIPLEDIKEDLESEALFDLGGRIEDLNYDSCGSASILDHGCIGLLLGILVSSIDHNKSYQREMLQLGLIDMIEYALVCINADKFQAESDGCVISLIQLQASVSDNKLLWENVTKKLLFNFKIWHKASFQFQCALMSKLLDALKQSYQQHMNIILVDYLVDSMAAYYGDQVNTFLSSNKSNSTYATINEVVNNDADKIDAALFSPMAGVNTVEKSMMNSNEGDDSSILSSATSMRFLDLSIAADVDNLDTSGNDDSVLTSINRTYSSISESNLISDDISEGYSGHELDALSSASKSVHSAVKRNRTTTEMSDDITKDSNMPIDILFDTIDGNIESDRRGSNTSLSKDQRKYLRECIQSMILILISVGASEKEMRPLLIYLNNSHDHVMMNEMAQFILTFIVHSDTYYSAKFMSIMAEICRGPEEFASFILHRLVHQPSEELRCTGIRILTHYYQRLENLPVSILTLTMRRRNHSVVTRTMDKITILSGGQGLQRLQVSGGLALLCEILSHYMPTSTEISYTSILEMLLTKPGLKSQVTLQNLSDNSELHPVPHLNSLLQRASLFSLSSEQISDDQSDMMNSYVLPVFFYLIPLLPVHTYGDILTNLLALLKHSPINRDAFAASTDPSWHTCLFDVLLQCIEFNDKKVLNSISNSNLVFEMNKYSNVLGVPITDVNRNAPSVSEYDSQCTNKMSINTSVLSQDLDTWFAIGMKVYSTMLLHSIDCKGGWKEMEKALAQSFSSNLSSKESNEFRVSVTQTILSHTFNELSFTIRSRVKEIKKLIKIKESTLALMKWENMLNIIVSSLLFATSDIVCSTFDVPNLGIAKLRLAIFSELVQEVLSKRRASDDEDSNSSSNIYDDLELRLVDRINEICESGDTKGYELYEGVKYDLGNPDVYWFFPSEIDYSSANSTPSGKTDTFSFTKSATPKYREYDFTRPLERGSENNDGRMVLMIQIVRLFDEIFWQNYNQISHFDYVLRYRKDILTFINEDNESTDKGDTKGLTLFSCIIRSCLFIHNSMSPYQELATLNIHRMRALFKVRQDIDVATMRFTPVHDWLMCVVLRIIFNIQRVATTLTPLYEFIGIKRKLAVTSYGPAPSSEEIKSHQQEEEGIFLRLSDEPIKLNKVKQFFANNMGKQLIEYIRASMNLLNDAYTHYLEPLGRVFTPDDLEFMETFIHFYLGEFTQSGNLFNGSNDSCSMNVPVFTKVNHAVDVKVGNNKRESMTTEDIVMNDDSDADSFAASEGTDTKESESKNDCDTYVGTASTTKTPLATQTTEGCPEINTQIIVSFLRLLRFHFLWIDFLRNERIMKLFTALEKYESLGLKSYNQGMNAINKEVQKSNFGVWHKVHEEIKELRDLNSSLVSMMNSHDKSRIAVKKSVESSYLKRAASSWHALLRTFEASWSPFSNEENQKVIVARAMYKLSTHRDRRMRRMVLERTNDTLDHSSAAYLEGKRQAQIKYSERQDEAMLRDQELIKDLLKAKPIGTSITSELNWGDCDDENEDDDSDLSEMDMTTSNTAASVEGNRSGLSIDSSSSSNVKRVASAFAGKTVDIIGGAINKISTQISIHGNNDKRPTWVTSSFQWASDEKMYFMSEATQIEVEHVVSGVLILSSKSLYFHPKKQIGGLVTATKAFKDHRWHLDRLREVYGRRYLLQTCGIELFFTDAPELFIAFKSPQILQKFYRLLRRQHTPLYEAPSKSLNPQHVFANSNWTEKWRKRLISNFEYIMRLNIIAGRSYNDITQYHVFPWVIAKYEGKTLNLEDPGSFRDLSKPVGALNPVRLKEILDRYNSFDEDIGVPKFMYGSHYSSAGVVIHFMIRQEPFTSLAIGLQGGKFDCPDRNFFDIKSTWHGCNNSLSDVKELIPEMFCCPEILINSNNFPLGELQEGGVVNDVRLPEWCGGDAFEFVRINREALESDYVSEHLHEWIDLIFGYKQRDEEAVKANNLFYYLTYENCAININNIEDPLQREATKSQVTHFGQTPSQLFREPHPKRLLRTECVSPLCGDTKYLSNFKVYPYTQMSKDGKHGAAIAVKTSSDRLVVLFADFSICYYKWSTVPDLYNNPFTLTADRIKILPSARFCMSEDVVERINPEIGLPSSNYNHSSISQTAGSISQDKDFVKNDVFINDDSNSTNAAKPRTSSISMFGFSLFGSPKSDSSVVQASSKDTNASTNIITPDLVPEAVAGSDQTASSDVYRHVHGNILSLSNMSNKNIALNVGEGGAGRIITCGYWDNTLKVHSLDSLKEIASSTGGHNGAITCVQLSQEQFPTLVTGGNDGTIRVWVVECPSLATALSRDISNEGESSSNETVLAVVHVLWGHNSSITALSYNIDLDIVFSGSEFGKLCIHTVSKGQFVRSMDDMLGAPVDVVLATTPGYLVAHSFKDLSIHLFWINGQHRTATYAAVKTQTFAVNSHSNVLVCGSIDGLILLRSLWNLETLYQIDLSAHLGITSLAFTDDYQYLLIGSEDGSFSVGADPEHIYSRIASQFQKAPIFQG